MDVARARTQFLSCEYAASGDIPTEAHQNAMAARRAHSERSTLLVQYSTVTAPVEAGAPFERGREISGADLADMESASENFEDAITR